MIPIWRRCAVGDPLYRAMCDEAEACGETLYTIETRPAWFAWTTHRDSCDCCRIERE